MNSYVARLTQKVTLAMINCSNNDTLTKQNHKRCAQFQSTIQFKYLNFAVTKMKQVTYFSLAWLVSPKELSLMQSGLSQLCTVCSGKKEWYINCCDISVLEFTAYKKE